MITGAELPVTLFDPTKEKLLGLLAAGVSQTSAALAIGVSDGYVSQLLDDPIFSGLLSQKRVDKLENAVAFDTSLAKVEERALKALDTKLAFVRNPLEAARIFQILNTAKQRTQLTGATAEALGAQQVTIVLPKAASVQISMNSSNQVIEVQGRSMATLPSRALPALAQDIIAKQKKLDSDDAARAQELLTAMSSEMVTTIGGVQRVL